MTSIEDVTRQLEQIGDALASGKLTKDELAEHSKRLEELAAEHERLAEPSPVEQAEAALEAFTGRFVERETKCKGAVFELEGELERLRAAHSEKMYAGEPTDEIVRQFQATEQRLAEARSALSLVGEWRRREAAKIRELEQNVQAAYQQELEQDFNRLQDHRARIAEAKARYVDLVVEAFKMTHAAADKTVAGLRFGRFPVPGFKNLEAPEIEVTLKDLHMAAGKPYSIPVIWAQVKNPR
ncbi:MAG TPA: hypothetical protein PK250_18525 [Syntrophobacter fumaroxidans]|nr:hypothetical protein [Syntrophobacter fumaroxidans]